MKFLKFSLIISLLIGFKSYADLNSKNEEAVLIISLDSWITSNCYDKLSAKNAIEQFTKLTELEKNSCPYVNDYMPVTSLNKLFSDVQKNPKKCEDFKKSLTVFKEDVRTFEYFPNYRKPFKVSKEQDLIDDIDNWISKNCSDKQYENSANQIFSELTTDEYDRSAKIKIVAPVANFRIAFSSVQTKAINCNDLRKSLNEFKNYFNAVNISTESSSQNSRSRNLSNSGARN